MDTRLEHQIEANTEESIIPLPPAWLAILIRALTPPVKTIVPPEEENASRSFILDMLWPAYQSTREVLLRLPRQLAWAISFYTYIAFYWKTALLQACILFMFFERILSWPVALVLGVTLAVLTIRDAYYESDEMLLCNIFTAFLAPELILIQSYVLNWLFPHWGIVPDEMLKRALTIGVLIGFCRHLYARPSGPEHPHKTLIDLHSSTWAFNCVWLAGWMTYFISADQIGAPTPTLVTFCCTNPAASLFITSIRHQLNPLRGIFRHRQIETTLGTDRYEDELVMKRNYLLVGAGWFPHPSHQAICEMVSFALSLSPLIASLVRWYMATAIIDWFLFSINAAAWLLLAAMWIYVKDVNRKVQAIFDEAIRRLRARKALQMAL
jgi:hypothetical protein